MIKRYSRKELTDIWSEENKYKIWLDVEIAAAQAMEKLNQIPKGVSSIVRKKARINVKRIHQIESQVKHDVIAFLTSVTEKAGIKARYLHQGMTSSDVVDTSFNIQLVQSGKIILKDLDQILKEDLLALNIPVEIINASVPGETTKGGLNRIDWSLQDDFDLFVLGLGANDLLRGIDPLVTKNNLEEIILKVKERKIPIFLTGMLAPDSYGNDFQSEFNEIFSSLAQKHQLLVVFQFVYYKKHKL